MAYDKVVDSAYLDELFAGIADAIRAKKGTSSLYSVDEMRDAIKSIASSAALAGEPFILNATYASGGGYPTTGVDIDIIAAFLESNRAVEGCSYVLSLIASEYVTPLVPLTLTAEEDGITIWLSGVGKPDTSGIMYRYMSAPVFREYTRGSALFLPTR